MPTILHRAARRLTGRLGWHGFGLLIIAVAWFIIGLRELLEPPVTIPSSAWHGLIAPEIRLVLWWIPAAGCAAAALDGNGPRRDSFALASAIVPPTFIGASMFWAWLMGDHPLGWYAAAFYLVLVAIVVLVAAHPSDRPPHP